MSGLLDPLKVGLTYVPKCRELTTNLCYVKIQEQQRSLADQDRRIMYTISWKLWVGRLVLRHP